MEIGKFNLIKTEGRARRGEFCTAHGVVQTPVFQNVGTAGAIKGAVDAFDLKELGCQIELSNTYHLHLRPGDQIVEPGPGRPAQVHALGRSDADRHRRLSRCSPWRPCARSRRKASTFHSHVDGRKHFHGAGGEHAHPVQPRLRTIAMAFDECIENPAAA